MLSPFLHARSPIFGHLKMSTFPIYIFVFVQKCGTPVLAAEVIKAKLTFNASQILFHHANAEPFVQALHYFHTLWNREIAFSKTALSGVFPYVQIFLFILIYFPASFIIRGASMFYL